jgi:hypothetical protein
MVGSVGILNVGAGDTKLSFDPNNPQDAIRAARIVKDMLRRGYALMVDTGKRDDKGNAVLVRATGFDETKHEYIIADFDPMAAQPGDEDEPTAAAPSGAAAQEIPAGHPARRGRKPKSGRIKASETSAVAVPRTAGG